MQISWMEWKMACIPVFTDQLSHEKQQLFQDIRRRFQRVFLHFWEGEFRKTSVFQRSSPGKRKENISYSEVFLAFSGVAISSEFKKTGAFFRGSWRFTRVCIFCGVEY